MTIFDNPEAAFAGRYPLRPLLLRHHYSENALFTLPALVEFAQRLPAKSIEYNSGDISVDQDPLKTPRNGLSPEETLRRIKECRSWMVLHNIEQDRIYKEALEECLAEIAPAAAQSTGPMHKKIGFIFISSPGSVTPLHRDPEHNILMQLQGEKRFSVYPPDKVPIPDEEHEKFHVGEVHRNLRHDEGAYDAFAETFDLKAGDAIYVPVKAPHWVRNGTEPSVSLSITWRSRASDAEARLRIANHRIRRWGGTPPPVGENPVRDAAAIFAQRAVSRLKHPFG